MNPAYRGIPPFAMFTKFTPALPQFYTGVPTMEQGFKELCKNFHKMVCYVDNMAEVQNLTSEEVEQLQKDFEKFQESGFFDYYAAQLEAWIKANMDRIFSMYAKLVIFGLDADGHFAAWIPENWSEIYFSMVAEYTDPLYGRLVLLYDAEGNFDYQYGSPTDVASYERLSFKPAINGNTLIGDKTFEQLGLVPITEAEIQEVWDNVSGD